MTRRNEAGRPALGAAPATGEPAGGGRGPATPGGTLFVVATPIGNLGDVTLRALEVLGNVPLIACEDTRVTRRLLERHSIAGRLVSFHARSGPRRLAELLEHLAGGRDLALATDAGTPGISDPGDALVASWASGGGRVVPIPGASAVLAAVAATGVAGPRWAFEGFLPRRGADRRERLARIAADDRGTVVFEAANRLGATLRDLEIACGGGRPGAVCRELTKVHEQILVGSLGELATAAHDGRIPRLGEVVVIVGSTTGHARRPPPDVPDLEGALAEVERRVAAGTRRGEAARAVAAETGIPRRRIYEPARGAAPRLTEASEHGPRSGRRAAGRASTPPD